MNTRYHYQTVVLADTPTKLNAASLDIAGISASEKVVIDKLIVSIVADGTFKIQDTVPTVLFGLVYMLEDSEVSWDNLALSCTRSLDVNALSSQAIQVDVWYHYEGGRI